ncbi:hypothetical protein Tco_0778448 [Tanacetum coccineum]
MMYNGSLRRKNSTRENSDGRVANFTRRINLKEALSSLGNFTYIVYFMIIKDISSVIDPRLSQVVIGKPFVEISNMTQVPLEGVVRWVHTDLEKEHTKSVYLRNKEDKKRGVEYVMSKILGFYKECLELGPEYLRGMDDEGEVTLYLMRRSLEVLRKFHWKIFRGRFNQFLHFELRLSCRRACLFRRYGHVCIGLSPFLECLVLVKSYECTGSILNSDRGVSNFTRRIKGMHVFVGNFTFVTDFMIVEDISSIIDPWLSQVVLGKPFVDISNMTHDPPKEVVRFSNGTEEVAYKMPYKIKQYNSLSNLEKEHTKSVYLRNEEDKRRGVEYVMSKILGFYKECLELGPEYATGMDDEGEVT